VADYLETQLQNHCIVRILKFIGGTEREQKVKSNGVVRELFIWRKTITYKVPRRRLLVLLL